MNSGTPENTQPCPCGTGKAYMACCGIFISNQKIPSTPEELMRSRYTAYHQANLNYIAQTMKPPAADHFDVEEVQEGAKKVSWIGLEVIKTKLEFNKGIVEFRASYSVDGKKDILHEVSEFIFEEGRWYYFNGKHPNKKPATAEKIGRNATCPCGSNKKYKKCCGNK